MSKEISSRELWLEIKENFPEKNLRERAGMLLDVFSMGLSATMETHNYEKAIDTIVADLGRLEAIR